MDTNAYRESSLIARIRELRTAEVTHLSAKHVKGFRVLVRMVYQYIRYLVYTWSHVLRSVVFLDLNPIDFVAVLTFALGSSFVLGVMLVICAMMKFLPVETMLAGFARDTQKYGFSFTDPMRIFRSITQSQVDTARAALARPPAPPAVRGERDFDIDIAKLLLQLSTLMYERGTDPVLADLAAVGKSPAHDASLATECQLDHDHTKDDNIRNFCRSFGFDYAAISELNASDSAYAALFWDPNSSWIVVAFKGTSPAEYPEWVSDFNYRLVDGGDWLPGFSQVHGGFLQRIFPSDVSHTGGTRPWDTITTGIKLVTQYLRQKIQDPDVKINVFFTGHSLGCATASLAYARAVLVHEDLGKNVVVRDAYVFAAPIVCDVASVKAFNGAINRQYDIPKTLWRVTNMKDFVATGLPDFGDRMDSHSMNNSLLNFAHLGAEIRMRSKPVQSVIAGWPHITRGLPVVVTSSLSPNLIGTVEYNEGLSPSMLWLQRLPFVGRFFQHAPSFYWDQLQRVGLGLCEWDKV